MSSRHTVPSEASTRLAGETALPRADVAAPPWRSRRDAWGRGRRWPFGPVATTVSIALHAVALVGIVWALAAPPEPEGIGAQVYAVLTPDLGDLEPQPLLDVPETLPELEAVELPTVVIEPALEPEPCLEPLCDLEREPLPSSLSLSIASLRVRSAKPEPPPTPTPQPVAVAPRPAPPPRPRPQAAPVARPRGQMPRGRLRPLAKPIRYPAAAQRLGIQGRARVAMTIDPRGSVVDVQLLASSGHGVLDDAALASARMWRFAPPGTFRRAAQTFRFSLN